MKFSESEVRVLGVLIEKAVTTPDQYPLSLNALTTGCNQKTNREPVVEYSDTQTQSIIDELIKKSLVSEMRLGGRVPKYQHRFCNTEFGEYHFNAQELGVICVLFLRGAQTPGELRTRTNRLCTFSDVTEVEQILSGLINRDGLPYVKQLPREAGRRDSRYRHLFLESDTIDDTPLKGAARTSGAAVVDVPATAVENVAADTLLDRIEMLELTVEELQQQIISLQRNVKD